MTANCSESPGMTNFKRMQDPLDFVFYFSFYLMALVSNACTEYLQKQEKLIPKEKLTLLNTFKMDYIHSTNRDITLQSFVNMFRLLVAPINYYLAVMYVLLSFKLRMKALINLIFLFGGKLILIKRPGYVESFDSRRLDRWLKIAEKVVTYGTVIAIAIGFCFMGNYYTRLLAYLTFRGCDNLSLAFYNIPIILFIGVLICLFLAEVIVNYRARVIDLKTFKVPICLYLCLVVGLIAVTVMDDDNKADEMPPLTVIVTFTNTFCLCLIMIKQGKNSGGNRGQQEDSQGGDNLHMD